MEKQRHTQGAAKASTHDVLGNSVGQSNVDPRWEKHYATLTRLRRLLLQRQKDLLSDASEQNSPPQRNLAELGSDEYEREFALSMASSEQDLLYEIEAALNRIKNGTYGTCEATGQPIAADRLRAIPWTRFSAEAEKKLEAEGQLRRARLGDREEMPKEQAGAPREEK